ncbi:MAG: DUF3313 family protein [Deltaproteobacteria bacterium]|nr:DUF3313 family protein [Deltaproteobacteria bacterium]
MKKLKNTQVFRFKHIRLLILIFSLIGGSIAFAADEGDLKKGDVTTDGLTVTISTRHTEKQIKEGIDWSEYSKYQITPVEVNFRKNWKRDYNRNQMALSQRVTDKDMTRIRESMGKIVYEEFDSALQEKRGLTKVDQADSNTLLFKPRIINLDVYAPDVDTPYFSRSYVRQAGRATLFLEVYDAVSGEILSRWVDTREDPDRGYFDWANRITNAVQFRLIVRDWANRLVEGLDDLKADKPADRRAWTGLDLFPSLLAADADIAEKMGPDGALQLLLVYQDRQDLAESMRTHLERVKKIQDIPIRIEIAGIDELSDRVEPSLAGIFLVEQAGDEIEILIRLGRKHRAVVFSPFAGDVERGVSSGMVTMDRIVPYVNIEAMHLSGIRIKPFFLRIAKQYGE